ncbi:Uu.00g133680.m01.CDS01 [Anthostomella pinea]|uniref:Uu.00g133680.m01.CDS01 n=1 Tax=Anthostomella pinea TaxID=933095 RepID=A0AAI8YKS1_9PEZI|nr:Uu.00g133680.m01.CDS01 [Anthostomella pinea]
MDGLKAAGDADPICIVGMACRLPGNIRSPSDLWNFLAEKKTAQGPVPQERFNIAAFYHPDGSRAGLMDAKGGYFLNEDVRMFENGFFGINAMEATYMDPQQRKLLELVFECFEGTGLSMEDVSGSNTGVYVGNFTVDYQTMQTRDPDYMHRYHATGSGTAIMSNRISHAFNLQGPSMTIDTACSSSIYCLHSAVSAIRNGECAGAIVAGANLITSPEQHLGTMKGGVLSPTSTCHTFDASADGYGRAEAVSAVYLKPLSSALQDGNKIWAVIRGTSVNASGKTQGITQPSAELQEKVIRGAYSAAGLNFGETDYVECHGTGTAVGDPIEVEALQACFGPRQSPLKIGSVKSNLGHSEAASGLTSLIKVVMAFEKGKIPPTYGVEKLNPKLDLPKANMNVVTDMEDWPRQRRRASINSFGYGGANAHLVVESFDSYLENPPQPPISVSNRLRQFFVVPVSAASSMSLDMRVEQVQQSIQHMDAATVKSLAFTLAQKRPTLCKRNLLFAQTEMDGSAKLVETEKAECIDPLSMNLPFAFIFTGQGAQYPQLGRELLGSNKTFRRNIQALDTILQNLPSATRPTWTIEQTISDPSETSKINHVDCSQPVCTAIQIALVNLLQNWGIGPLAVVGHSSGEIAAAYTSNLLNSSEALLTAYFRGFAVQRLMTRGTMVAAGIGPDAAKELIIELGLQEELCLACINSPYSVTFSGSQEGAEHLLQTLHGRKVFARKLATGGRAYHSHLVKAAGQLYEELLEPILDKGHVPEASAVKMYSSVETGHGQHVLNAKQCRKARYWRDNLETSVQFSEAMRALLEDGKKFHIIEIGPHPAFKGAVQQILAAAKLDGRLFPYSATLVRNRDAEVAIKSLAASLYLHGYKLQWEHVNSLSPDDGQVILHDLAPYPWDYSAGLQWYEPRPSVELRNRKYRRHELLGSAQLANNGINWAWRNVLRLNEALWLSDHKIEHQVVFPAVGYLAIGIEAISQVFQVEEDQIDKWFEFRNVTFTSALVIPQDVDARTKEVEIHTTLSARKISNTNTSEDWFEFSISSWIESKATLHCSGSIRLCDTVLGRLTRVEDAEDFDHCTLSKWYEKLAGGGLCFGPYFQSLDSLRTDSNHQRTEAISTTTLTTKVGKATDTVYPVHPVSMDACLQAAIMGSTAGNLYNLKAFMPVFIAECRIRGLAKTCNEEATIHTCSTTTGFSTKKVDCTLLNATGEPVVMMEGVRLSLYAGNLQTEETSTSLHLQRNPTLCVRWKPDVLRVRPGSSNQLNKYVDNFSPRHEPISDESDVATVVGALLDLVGHNKPRFRALQIGPRCQRTTKYWLSLLDNETALPRIQSWNTADLSIDGTLTIDKSESGPFDALVIGGVASESERIWSDCSEQFVSLLGGQGIIITSKTNAGLASLAAAGFTVVETRRQIVLGVKQARLDAPVKGRDFLIVHKDPSPALENFAKSLSSHLKKAGAPSVSIAPLADLRALPTSPDTICISLLEVERELLATMTPGDMDLLRSLTDFTTHLLWLTGANMLGDNPDPDLTLSSGISRALMMEQPSLRFSTLDLGSLGNLDLLASLDNAVRALATYEDVNDKEFIQVDDVLYTSRFAPNVSVNDLFRRRMGHQDPVQKGALSTSGPARLAIARPGITDTLHFQQIRSAATTPPAGFIDVEVKAVSLNAKDVYNISGHVETRSGTSALEFCGVVTAVALDVSEISVGDRVVVMAPNYFSTVERVPAWSAHRMLPGEDDTVLCTIPIAYATALYALLDRGRLRAGESVLIHAGAGAFGTAAIALAQHLGATVYTTCSTQAKRRYLTDELGVPPWRIFNSRNASFAEGIRTATGDRGVDLVINSLVGDLLHASWNCLANFGRFVEIGKRELVDIGKLQMDTFLRNTTFTAFDLSELFYHEDQYYRDIWISKTKEALELYRAGRIKPGPITTYDVSEITQAFRAFSSRDRVGKIVVLFPEDAHSQIPLAPSRYLTLLDSEKIYLLVGCLGGLGRSLSRWMLQQGARNFAFLGRSGADKPSARALVDYLKGSGANVMVISGDVSIVDDVQAVIEACLATGRSIGGVVQAAVGLREGLFSRMTNEAWHAAVQPKWKGTWNLHNALGHIDDALDFFLLTSSVSGSIATATESNYCAANGFLDAWARWRRLQGKKAVSVGLGMISEVGYLHENPDIEALLLRKGIQPLNEQEFLQVIDLALSGEDGDCQAKKPGPGRAHMLTGLESHALRELVEKGWDMTSGHLIDPRCAIISASLLAQMGRGCDSSATVGLANAPDWLAGYSPTVVSALASESGSSTLVDAIAQLARRRLSALILMPVNQVDETQAFAQFGVDSMTAAEFRTWIWNTFKVDIPFLDLLSNQKTLASLAGVISEKLRKV